MAIKHKLAACFGLLFVLMLAILWLTLKLQLEQTLSQQSRTLGQILARQTADSVTELVLANDLLGLNVVLGQLTAEQGVQTVTVSNVDGQVLASSTSDLSTSQTLTYEAPITLQDAVAGRVTLLLDATLLSNPLARPQTVFYIIILVSLVLVLVLSWILANIMAKPARQILAILDDPDESPDSLEIEATGDEFELLQMRIVETLAHTRRLEKQVAEANLPDPAAWQKLNLRAERRMTSLLLVEVTNMNHAIELLHPATLSSLLQEYQFYLRQAARLYRGVVNRIDGCRALVTFDIRHCQEDHAINAICSGQLFLRLMQKVADKHRENHAQSLDFRLAVHTGDAYFSPLWKKHKPGREPKREETVIGKSVDLAYALITEAPFGQMLASELSFDMSGGIKRFPHARSLPLDNDSHSLMTYILDAGDGTHGELLDRQRRHLMPEPGDEAPAGADDNTDSTDSTDSTERQAHSAGSGQSKLDLAPRDRDGGKDDATAGRGRREPQG